MMNRPLDRLAPVALRAATRKGLYAAAAAAAGDPLAAYVHARAAASAAEAYLREQSARRAARFARSAR